MAERDLEKERDERCFPVAQAMMEGISKGILEENGIRDVALASLELTLAQDLNVSQDMTYIPQLLLGLLSGANATVQRSTTVPLDTEKYKNVAKKILIILAEAKLKMDLTADKIEENYAGVKEKFDALFLEEKLNSLETKYIMDSIFDAFAAFNNMFSNSVESSMERVTAIALGLDNTSDLTMKDMDDVLKKDAASKVK